MGIRVRVLKTLVLWHMHIAGKISKRQGIHKPFDELIAKYINVLNVNFYALDIVVIPFTC